MKKSKIIITILALALASQFSEAKVLLPQIISEGMVVQRDRPLTLWGTADPGEMVTVKVVKGNKTTVTADSEGKWRVILPALKTGKDYTIEVNDIVIPDVVVGDVLLCSGQSNMELPVNRVTDMYADEIAEYKNPAIRQFLVPKEVEFHGERTDVSATAWKSADDNVMNFSAVAYFTAKALNEKTGLPVGIINASWGGTPVESWISEESLADYPFYLNKKHIYDNDAYRDAIKAQEGRNYAAWNSTVDAADPGLNGELKYYSLELDDSTWKEVDLLSTDWATDGLNPINGTHWFRRTINIDDTHAGLPATLRLGCIVDADSVWVNGKQVGFTSYMYPPRIYPIPQGLLKSGENTIAIRLISGNGTPHFVPEKPYKIIFGDRPYARYGVTNDDEISLEGAWKYAPGAPMPGSPSMMFYCYLPAVLYNSMIAPVIGYPVRGAVWYQGESNVSNRNQYPAMLETMIGSWRNASGDTQMPFYIIELADFLHPTDVGGREAWKQMRKYQAQVANETPVATLIRNSDLGEWNDIHPLDKKTLGCRIADAIASDIANAK
ncbi:MAG: beta galactosidase jelly roll domain-containing protein [Duncaniella sp.]|nr:beta galactosidase jelly roll domain-containing protein [Muribaculum sp.]MCM1255906.1 beta galactosidase jelly roll domain-containing protein [Duncaniella sp.]